METPGTGSPRNGKRKKGGAIALVLTGGPGKDPKWRNTGKRKT